MSAAETSLDAGKMTRMLGHVVDVIKRMSARFEDVKTTRPDNKYAFGYVAADTLSLVQLADGADLFLGILREYKLSTVDRKAVEAAVKLAMRKRHTSPKTVDEARETAQDYLEAFAHALTIAERVLSQGNVCEKNECKNAGCFRVVNAGGFDARVMAVAEREVAEAARLVEAAGFPEVCYGDAYVTQQISRSNVLAFWMPSEDRMYIRAKPKKGEESLAVETVVHELGHRFEAFSFEVKEHHVVVTIEPFMIKLEFTYRAFETFRARIQGVDLKSADHSRLQ